MRKYLTLPANLDVYFENKKYSLYYELLVKQLGQAQADLIWHNRNKVRNDENLYDLVKDYKPRDQWNLIGDFNWGYNSIKDNHVSNNKTEKSF